eukprot:scaffold1351_cov359-Prasinococcus_capsulatus_cf.AAC.10
MMRSAKPVPLAAGLRVDHELHQCCAGGRSGAEELVALHVQVHIHPHKLHVRMLSIRCRHGGSDGHRCQCLAARARQRRGQPCSTATYTFSSPEFPEWSRPCPGRPQTAYRGRAGARRQCCRYRWKPPRSCRHRTPHCTGHSKRSVSADHGAQLAGVTACGVVGGIRGISVRNHCRVVGEDAALNGGEVLLVLSGRLKLAVVPLDRALWQVRVGLRLAYAQQDVQLVVIRLLDPVLCVDNTLHSPVYVGALLLGHVQDLDESLALRLASEAESVDDLGHPRLEHVVLEQLAGCHHLMPHERTRQQAGAERAWGSTCASITPRSGPNIPVQVRTGSSASTRGTYLLSAQPGPSGNRGCGLAWPARSERRRGGGP